MFGIFSSPCFQSDNYNFYSYDDSRLSINYDNNEKIHFFSDSDQPTELKWGDISKKSENQDENLDVSNLDAPESKKEPIKNLLENHFTNGDIKTKATSNILGIKTKRTEEVTFGNEMKKNQGRKKKTEKDKGKHNKFSEDNLMRKIKSHFLDYIHNRLNNSFRNKNVQFLKLFSEINENLKRSYNIELLDKTIREIYENSPLSGRYRKINEHKSDINKNIIKQIFNEVDNKEEEVIQILNSTYKDLLSEFRNKNNLKNFLNKIKQEEKKKEEKENIDNYILIIENLCLNYENWFLNKKGRNREKKNENNEY